MEDFVTLATVAKECGIRYPTLLARTRKCELETKKIEHLLLIHRKDVPLITYPLRPQGRPLKDR